MGNTAVVLFAVLTAGCACCHATVVAEPVNLAAGKPYVLSAKPNYRECTNDAKLTKLTDGTYVQKPSKLFWLLPTTVGWIGPSTVKVDLGKSENVSGFFWHGAFRHGSGVNAPESVAVYVSEDDASWTYAGDLLMKTREKGVDPVAGREAVFMLDSKDMPCRGRYVLFVPAQSPMIFVDEVGVWVGDANAVDAAWPNLERGVDPKKHVASVRLRARIFRDVTVIGEKTPDGLLERIRSLRCDSGLAGLRTELPFNAVHAEVWALNARRLRAAGFEKPVLWKNNRWDNLDALTVPAKESTAFGRIEVEMMRNETRAETVNVLNPTDRTLDCELEVAGLPGEAHVDCLEVLFTDTSAGVPVSGALKPGAGRRIAFSVPAGTSRQIWISFARPKGRAGTYDGKVVVRAGGETLEAPLRLVLHNLDFPDRPRLHTGGWDYLDGDGNYFKAAGSRASSLKLMKEEMYADTAWATAGVQPRGAKFGEDGVLLNADALDFSRWDDWVERIWPEARVFAVFANPGEVLGRDLKPGDPRYDRRAETYFRAWAAHARGQGIGRGKRPFVLHLVDEPHTTNDVERFLRAARPVAKVRDISVFCTPSFNKDVMKDVPQEFFDLCEVMCPGVLNMTENGYHADFRRRVARNGELWVYSCHGARTFDPIRYHRVQSWYAFQIGAKGSFFWAYGCGGGIGDSWHAYAQKSIEYSPFFISPSDGAMRSKQSEGIREGAEDYELLMMAREKGMPPEWLAALVRRAMTQDPSGRDDFTRTGLMDWNASQDRESMDRSRLEMLRFLSGGVPFSRYRFDAGKDAPKLFYDAYRPIECGSESQVAIVLIHGWGGHVRTLLPTFTAALSARVGSERNTPYVIAPQFPRHETIASNGEPEDGRAVWCDSWADEDKHPEQMGSASDDWRGGGDANGTSFSSYDYVDAIFARFADRLKYPNLHKVVLAGFSAGGQFAGRYAATGKGVVRDGVRVVYIAMSPSTEFRFDTNQPWLYGLKGRPRYSAALTEAEIMKNLCSRRVWRGCGSLDVLGRPRTSLDMTPPAAAQGANRFERFKNFERYLDKYPEWKKQVSFHVFEGIAHKEDLCYPDSALLDFVFE